MNLTTSKTKHFSETSSSSKLTTSKTKQFCETSFRNGTLTAELTASYQCVLRFFPLHLSKVLRLPRKSEARSHEVLHLSCKNHLSKPEDLMLQSATLSGNQHPDLLTSLMNMSLVLRLPRDMHLCRSSSNVPRLPTFLKLQQNPHVLLPTIQKLSQLRNYPD